MKFKSKSKYSQRFHTTIRASMYVLRYVWNADFGKRYIFLKILQALLNSVFPLIYTVFPGLIVNELTNNRNLEVILVYTSIIVISPVLSHLINTVINQYTKKLQLKISLNFDLTFYTHSLQMDYETFEDPDIQLTKTRSQNTLNNIWKSVHLIFSFISSLFSFVLILSIVSTLSPLVVCLILIFMLLNSLITKKINQKLFELDKQGTEYDRHRWGITYMIEQNSYAKEVRLFGIKSLLLDMYEKNQTKTNELNLDYQKTQNVPTSFQVVASFVQQSIIYAYLIYSVIVNGMPVGSMTIYISGYTQFTNAIRNMINVYLNMSKNSLNIQEMIDFLHIPLKQYQTGKDDPIFDENSVIEFKNVSFKYPGSEIYAIRNLNITLRGSEKLCIVGANGSGKSTFIKLLTRLYFPTEGEILLNGVNINNYDYEKYLRLFAPVFQDFVRYYFSLGTNIALSTQYDTDKIDAICTQCGLKGLVEKLPHGYDTQVDKWIDPEGFEPSGGEDQRIAIARACYHSGDIFLLDEPTAALDPVAEYEIYTQFNNMITDKCAVLITHRLSAVQLADKVAVFDNGSVAEYGTHKELYEKGGIYTEMFDKQAQFYRD